MRRVPMVVIVRDLNLLDVTPNSIMVTKHSMAIAADKFEQEPIFPSPIAA